MPKKHRPAENEEAAAEVPVEEDAPAAKRRKGNWVVKDTNSTNKDDEETKDSKKETKETKEEIKDIENSESDEKSKSDADSDSDSDASDSSDASHVNVDFDFEPITEIDFHGLKTLLRQLIPPHEAPDLDYSDLSDHIIALGATYGTVVKVAEGSGDPFAICTLLPLDGSRPGVKSLAAYLERRAPAVKSLKRAGFLLNERLVNMPPQLAPKLFQLLREELDSSSITFDSIIYLSKTYREIDPVTIDDRDLPPSSKPKPKPVPERTVFPFNAEDELLLPHAKEAVEFKLPKDPTHPDGYRVFSEFGIEPGRKVAVFEWKEWRKGGKKVEEMGGL